MTEESGVQRTGAVALESIICVGCGYNLQHLSREGSCPECGKSVTDSLIIDAIERTDPQWAMDIAKGINWVVYYTAAVIIYMIFSTMFGMIIGVINAINRPPGSPPPNGFLTVNQTPLMIGFNLINGLIGVGLGLFFLFAAERLTRKEPGRENSPRPYEAWRVVSRVALPVAAFFTLVGLGLQIYQAFFPFKDMQDIKSRMVVLVCLGLVGMVVWSVLLYVVVLIPADAAERIGAPALQRQAKRIVKYTLGIFLCTLAMIAWSVLVVGVAVATSTMGVTLGLIMLLPFTLAIVVLSLVMVVEVFLGYPKIARLIKERVLSAHPGVVR